MNIRRAILSLVAIVLLFIWANGALLLLVVMPVAYGVWKWRERHCHEEKVVRPTFENMDEAMGRLGEPSDVVTIDATRVNELVGNILIYDEKRLIIIRGVNYRFEDIRSVSFVNAATPYTVGEYQLLIDTVDGMLRLPVGYDSDFASHQAEAIYAHLHSDEKKV